ncbi:MAG TPA: hypothetical protein VK249_01645 [Anaerolineales bacterium]|nr:hypothetical protein [Anaerolineales bacterium]
MVSRLFRALICGLGLALAIPLLILIGFALVTPITTSGIGYLIGYFVAVVGMITVPLWRKYAGVAMLGGLTIIVLIACLRIVLARNEQGSSNLKMILFPPGEETRSRWVNYLLDEQDSVLFGEAALLRLGGVWPHEHENIVAALYQGYSELRTEQKIFPSPFAGTYLGLERQTAFDTILIEPKTKEAPNVGVVFLHGYMGNVTLQCWRIAQAVQALGFVTACPSTDWTGDWWEPEGQAMVRTVFRYLHERGIQTIYLSGFSNGSLGASRLAPALAHEDASLKGLFLIAGVTNAADIRKMGLPVLVIQGTEDQRMPLANAQQFIAEVGELGTYAEIPSDHFLIMKEPVLVQKAIRSWLEKSHHGDTKTVNE